LNTNLSLTEKLYDQLESILDEFYHRTEVECTLLIDISGQVICTKGQLEQGDPVQVAALAAGDVAAMAELSRQVGEQDPQGSFLHEGQHKSLYLYNVDDSFILIAIFDTSKPIGLIRLFVRRTAEQLYPLTDEFEEMVEQPSAVSSKDFSTGLARELDKAFTL